LKRDCPRRVVGHCPGASAIPDRIIPQSPSPVGIAFTGRIDGQRDIPIMCPPDRAEVRGRYPVRLSARKGACRSGQQTRRFRCRWPDQRTAQEGRRMKGALMSYRKACWFCFSMLVLLLALPAAGCSKSPPWPPPGFSPDANDVCFRLVTPQVRASTHFNLGWEIVIRRHESKVVCFSPQVHGLELRVFRPDGSEVAPVVRPNAMRAFFQGGVLSGGGRSSLPLDSPPEVALVDKDGRIAVDGRHTIDIWSRYWDLLPGRYVLRGRLFSGADAGVADAAVFGGSIRPDLPHYYWVGDVELPPLEIEVAPPDSSSKGASG